MDFYLCEIIICIGYYEIMLYIFFNLYKKNSLVFKACNMQIGLQLFGLIFYFIFIWFVYFLCNWFLLVRV